MSPRTVAALTLAVMMGVLVGSCTFSQDNGTGTVPGTAVASMHPDAPPVQEGALLSPRTVLDVESPLVLSASPTPVMASSAAHDATPSLAVAPAATPTYALILVPTNTPDRTASTKELPVTPAAPVIRTGVPSLDRFRAQGSFTNHTEFADGRVTQQSGHFELARTTGAGPYRWDEFYRLTTRRDDSDPDTITVYQIGDQIAVDFGEGDWVVTPRSQGSTVVKAIQPVVDLSAAFLSRLDQAEKVGEESVDGRAAIHYRIADVGLFTGLFSQWLPGIVESVVSVQLDGWLADGDSYLVKYEFQAELANTPALDSNFTSVTADQSLHWTYQVTDAGSDLPLAWPEDAPRPGSVQVPGFNTGSFPIPPDAQITSSYAGLPELVSTMSEGEVAQFYEENLAAHGWSIEGEHGLYILRNGEHSLILIIDEDTTLAQTRISILTPDGG